MSHHMIDAIVLDIDGTIKRSDGSIAPRTIAAVGRAVGLGIPVVLASSRGPRGLRPTQRELGVADQPFVAFQGAYTGWYTEADGTLRAVSSSRIPNLVARQVLRAAEELGFTVCWYEGENWYVRGINAAVEHEIWSNDHQPRIVDLDDLTGDPNKFLCIAPPGDPDARMTALTTTLPEGIVGRRSAPMYLEVTGADIDKPVGVAALAGELGWRPRNILAIGDGENDLGLFAYAGFAVAMGNAEDTVAAAARFRTTTNNDDGVAVVLEAIDTDRRITIPPSGTFSDRVGHGIPRRR